MTHYRRHARWRTAEETIQQLAAGDHAMHGLLIKTVDGNVQTNPLVSIAAKAADDMVRVASDFGSTPVARARIAAGVGPPSGPSKFDGFLG